MSGPNRTILSNDTDHYVMNGAENVVYISDISLRFRFGTEQHLNGISSNDHQIDLRKF